MKTYTKISVLDIYDYDTEDLEHIEYTAVTEEILRNLSSIKTKQITVGSDFSGLKKFKELRIVIIREEQIKFLENLNSIALIKDKKEIQKEIKKELRNEKSKNEVMSFNIHDIMKEQKNDIFELYIEGELSKKAQEILIK